ncbi:DoxX family protein [Streptomyces sp. NPDC087903]|uniref:DoxX family protein n=1 Tax=Streptomyces sp. NPDC087903 TaxID=3365819 RepID=UPI00380B1D65
MNTTLWIAAGLLTAVALAGGISKTFIPKARLAAQQGGEWTHDANSGFIKTLGVLELLAAIGLILPAALDIAPVMVPVTAVCWIALMVGAMITHSRLGQSGLVLLNSVYLALALFMGPLRPLVLRQLTKVVGLAHRFRRFPHLGRRRRAVATRIRSATARSRLCDAQAITAVTGRASRTGTTASDLVRS